MAVHGHRRVGRKPGKGLSPLPYLTHEVTNRKDFTFREFGYHHLNFGSTDQVPVASKEEGTNGLHDLKGRKKGRVRASPGGAPAGSFRRTYVAPERPGPRAES